MATANPAPLPPHVLINQMITGSWLTQAIFVAAELGVADALHEGPLTPAELAPTVGAHAESLHRILRALASVGIFREREDGRFEQTPLSGCLRSDSPGSIRAWARVGGAQWFWEQLACLLNSARTGERAPLEIWEHFEHKERDNDIFNQSMTSFSASEIGPILQAYDFTGIRKLMDVAGGYGSLLAAVLEANPQMRGILFDAPSVIKNAHSHIAATKVADRCELVEGDFFASVPAGADAIMMKHIIHDWNDEKSLQILKCCHAALPAGGKLLVIESVIQPGNDPAPGKFLDLVMLLVGGRERTEAQFRSLLAAGGFEVTRIVPTACPVSVVEARKA